MKYFIGLQITISLLGIFVNQRKYTPAILADSGNLGSRATTFPMDQNLKLTPDDGTLIFDPGPYRN